MFEFSIPTSKPSSDLTTEELKNTGSSSSTQDKSKVTNKVAEPTTVETAASTSGETKVANKNTSSSDAIPSSSRASTSVQEDSDEQEMLRRRRLEKFTREPSVD